MRWAAGVPPRRITTRENSPSPHPMGTEHACQRHQQRRERYEANEVHPKQRCIEVWWAKSKRFTTGGTYHACGGVGGTLLTKN